jgi:hypothetical protein
VRGWWNFSAARAPTFSTVHKNMKTQLNAKSELNGVPPSESRAAGIRPHAAKTLEHRSERRKIREHLRRLDWALNVEDEIFA